MSGELNDQNEVDNSAGNEEAGGSLYGRREMNTNTYLKVIGVLLLGADLLMQRLFFLLPLEF